MKNIGPELNRIMTERRIVRKDIAKEVGITPTYLSAHIEATQPQLHAVHMLP